MTDDVLYVVPTDRHVERIAREGATAETRRALQLRLTQALLPTVEFAETAETRLVLSIALSDPTFESAGQLALFDTPAMPATANGGDLLAPVRSRGGASWSRLVSAVDDAVGRLRAAGATADHLRRVSGGEVTVSRASMLANAIDGLDQRLGARGVVDGRIAGRRLAETIGGITAERLVELIGYRRVRSRWNLDWSRDDLSWWRALDEKLVRVGGWARIVLPAFDRPLQGRTEADPLDELAEQVAGVLDDAPETEVIDSPLGTLTTSGLRPAADRVSVVRTADATGQARETLRRVTAALADGAAVDRIAIALPVLDEHSVAPLRRALDAAGIPFFEHGAETHSTAPVVAAALLALEAAETLERTAVSRLLRCGYIDATRFVPGASPGMARRTVARAAQRLDARSTAAAATAVERLALTAASDQPAETAALRQIGAVLEAAQRAVTRGERILAARRLWTDLGLVDQAGRGGLDAFGHDERPSGVVRAERAAVARDTRAWEALSAAVELAERVTLQMGATEQPIDADAFRAELLSILDSASRRPAAGRAGAVRIGRVDAFVGEQLDCLSILDCVDGRLPAGESPDRLLTVHLTTAIAKASRGAFRPPKEGLARAKSLTALAAAVAESRSIQLLFPTEDAMGALQDASPVVDAIVRGGVPIAAEMADTTAPSATTAVRAHRERTREGFFLDPARPRSDLVGEIEPRDAVVGLLTQETGGGTQPLAVTSLERFARCAFRGTAEVVFGARDPERRQELPDAREEGTVVHEALAAAFTAAAPDWQSRPRNPAVILEKAFAAVDRVLDAWQGHAALRAIVRLRVREGARAVLLAALVDERWDFADAEQPFGGLAHKTSPSTSKPWPVVDLYRGADHLRLRGTIDRVDLAHDRSAVRVIDYKRSGSTVKESLRSLGETALQIPLYAGIASRQTGLPAEGAYMATQARDLATLEAAGSKKNQERLVELLTKETRDGLTVAEVSALDLVAAVRAGNLVPIPAAESECRTCSVSGGCRKPRFAMVAADDGEDSG